MIQQVMYANAVVATMHRVMCARDVAQMILRIMMPTMIAVEIGQVAVDAVRTMLPIMTRMTTAAATVCVPPTTALNANRAVPTTRSPIIVEEVAAVDAAVMTPPATTVVDKVAAATIRAKFGLPAALEG
jgi:hypothetical protein